MENVSIIFDLDGTLWDTTYTTYKAANLISKKYHFNEIEMSTIKEGMGNTKLDNARLYFPNIDINIALNLLSEISKKKMDFLIKENIKIYPNVDRVLSDLSTKMNLYMVSNSSNQNYVNTFIKYVDCFNDALAAGSMGLNKSDGIRYIMEKNEIKDAIYVGDTKVDKESALNVNIPFIYADYGFGNVDDNEYKINNINELENEISKVKRKVLKM